MNTIELKLVENLHFSIPHKACMYLHIRITDRVSKVLKTSLNASSHPYFKLNVQKHFELYEHVTDVSCVQPYNK